MKSETFRFQVGSFSCIAIQDDCSAVTRLECS